MDKGVSAFSILTEKEYFKGKNDFIKVVREKFPEMPILRKDFIYTPFQVAHAKFLGASAILLIVRMLDDKTLLELHKLAQDLEMDVLVETHDEEEIRRTLKIPNLEILGINNRNLNTFEVDIKTTEKLINEIPSDVFNNLTIISESGFLSKKDVEYAEKLNVGWTVNWGGTYERASLERKINLWKEKNWRKKKIMCQLIISQKILPN